MKASKKKSRRAVQLTLKAHLNQVEMLFSTLGKSWRAEGGDGKKENG